MNNEKTFKIITDMKTYNEFIYANTDRKKVIRLQFHFNQVQNDCLSSGITLVLANKETVISEMSIDFIDYNKKIISPIEARYTFEFENKERISILALNRTSEITRMK